jgi:hypothetical protein
MPTSIEVELPDGSIAEFPDDMPQEQIHEAVKKHFAKPPKVPEQPSQPDTVQFSNEPAEVSRVPVIKYTAPTPKQTAAEAMAERLHPRALMMDKGGTPIPETKDQPSPLATVAGAPARFLSDVGKGALNLGAQGAFNITGQGEEAEKLLSGDMTPLQEGTKLLPPVPQTLARTGQSILETGPKLAAVVASGPAAPATGAYLFGFDDEGKFHPDQAAINAALPMVSKLGGGIATTLAGRLGVSSDAALNLINAGGRYGTANAVLSAQALPGWEQMTDDQKAATVGGILANGLVGLADFHGIKSEGGKVDLTEANRVLTEAAERAKQNIKPIEAKLGQRSAAALPIPARLATAEQPARADVPPVLPPEVKAAEKVLPLAAQAAKDRLGEAETPLAETVQVPAVGADIQSRGTPLAKPTNLPKTLNYTIRPNGKYDISMSGEDGLMGLEGNLTKEQLVAKVGPEMAQQIIDHKGDTPATDEYGYKRGKFKVSELQEKLFGNKGGDSNASSQQETAAVHGDVREQPGESAREVPAEGSGAGVQPPEEQEQAAPEVALKPEDLTDQNLAGQKATATGQIIKKEWFAKNNWSDPKAWTGLIEKQRDSGAINQNSAEAMGLHLRELNQTDPAAAQEALKAARVADAELNAKMKALVATGDFGEAAKWSRAKQFARESAEFATQDRPNHGPNVEKGHAPPIVEGEVVKPKEVIPGEKEEKKEDAGVLNQPAGGEQPPALVDQPVKKAVAKVAKAVADPGIRGRTPKDIKNELLARVKSELDSAPSEDEYLSKETKRVNSGQKVSGEPLMFDKPLSEIKNEVNRNGIKVHSKEIAAALEKHAPKVTIDIPGDGTFTIFKTKEALSEVLRRANKLDTSSSAPMRVERSGISKADKEWIAQQKAAQERQPVPAGPGAATRPGAVLQTDIGQFESNIPPLEQLADAINRFPKQPGGGFKEKLKQWMDDVGIPAKDFATRALVGAKAATARVIDAFTNLPKVTSMDRAVGRWNLEDTEGDLAARRFADAVKKTFPDRSKLRALSNYINAGGDRELLERQAALTKDPELKKTYTDALKFGKDEARLADEIKFYHDQMLSQAMEAGALEEGVEDYLHRYYPRETDPTRKKIESALNEYRFTKNFAGFKRRFYDSDFEAEQAGLKPEKDAAKRILAYDQGFRKALTARAFVKDRYAATMPDGRPEIDVAGVGVPSKADLDTGKESPYLIKPKSKASGDSPEDYRGDYVTFDHPAFRRWKWVGADATGKPILMEGEMAVHPDAVKKYRALFERSWFQKNPLGKALLMPSHFVKQTMLALSAFHPVQIGIHALEHKTNPFNLVDLNTRDPAQAKLIEGGLVVSDLGGGNHFSEGVSGSGLFGKLPIAGEMIKGGQDWLFKDFIPRIKMTMALDALERNRKAYAKDIASGKITDEQLVRLTAREANAAFGEQNYRAMFRHKGFQDVLRFAFLAPDFGEARLRFPLQALTKYGGEQRMALFLGALGMFVAAKSAEKMLTGQMNLSRPFSVTYKDREYGLRNVASDLYHMITDPAGYLRNRLNPIYTRPVLEMLSGRDAFGRKRDVKQQALDEAKQIVPISGRGLVEKDQKLWESFVNAIGLTEHRRSAFGDEMKAVNDWKAKKGYTEPGEFVYDADKDPYSGLTRQLTYGDAADVRNQLDKLTAGKTPAEARRIADHYRRSLVQNKFLTGSRAHETEYLKGLSASDRQRYDAAKAERKAMWDKFVKAWRSKYPAAAQ